MEPIPTEALPLLGGDCAVCYVESFARYIARHSRGGLVVASCGKEWLLVPAEVWAKAEADVRGIAAEAAAACGLRSDGSELTEE